MSNRDLLAFYALVYRHIKRFIRYKSRIVTSFIQPILWFVFFGIGWSYAFNIRGLNLKFLFGGVDYLKFLLPGVVMMTVFTSSFMSGLSVLWDREFGFLKELLVSPASRIAILCGRVLGDSIIVTLQGVIMLAILSVFVGSINLYGIIITVLISFITALIFVALGITIASYIKSMEAFHMITGFITLPMLFLSGAFYPIDPLPEWMKILALIDPLTYSVDLARNVLIGVSSLNYMIDCIGIIISLVVFISLSVFSFKRTYIA